jgi:hypothetical protein
LRMLRVLCNFVVGPEGRAAGEAAYDSVDGVLDDRHVALRCGGGVGGGGIVVSADDDEEAPPFAS